MSHNPVSPNLQTVNGTTQTARDWSGDFDNLQGIPPDQEVTAIGARLKASAACLARNGSITNTLLAASATFTGSAMNTVQDALAAVEADGNINAMTHAITIGALAFADQAGTIRPQADVIGLGTFRSFSDTSVSVSTLTGRAVYVIGSIQTRVLYVNGGIAQGVFEFTEQGIALPHG